MIEELYKKKIIRDFLSLFSESKWKELIFLSVEYGIILLKQKYNVASLSLDDLNNIVDEIKEEENKRMRKNLKKYETELKVEKTRSGSKTNQINSKPSSGWRKGDETVFDPNREVGGDDLSREKKTQSIIDKILMTKKKVKNKPSNNSSTSSSNIYPRWWGDANKTMFPKKSNQSKVSSRNNSKVKSKYMTEGYHSSNESNSNFKLGREKLTNQNKKSRALSYEKVKKENLNIQTNSANMITNNPYFDKKKVMEVESKIKSRVETDKKIFSMLRNKNRNEEEKEYYQHDEDQNYDRNYQHEESQYEKYRENNQSYYQENNESNIQNQENSNLYQYQQTDECQNDVSRSHMRGYENISQNNISYNDNHRHEQYYENPDNSQLNKSEITQSCMNQSQSYYDRDSYYENSHNERNRQTYHNSSQFTSNNKSNYVIEYDKDLKPQVIKEKDIKTKNPKKQNIKSDRKNSYVSRNENYPRHQKQPSNVTRSDMSYSKNFPQDSPYLIPTEISHIDQNGTHDRFNPNAFESIYNSQQISDRNGDTILREQFINNYITKQKKRSSNFNNLNNQEDSNISVAKSNQNENNSYKHSRRESESLRNKYLSEHQMANFTGRESTTEVLSPHFNSQNNYIKYNREVVNQNNIDNIKRTLSGQSTPHNNAMNNYVPFTIQNEEFIQPAVSFKRENECQ